MATDAVLAAPEPLTATLSGMPSEHDGQSEFTFGLTFSEEFGLSYLTLRDDGAFNVTGGAVRKAKRNQQGSNRSWTIHVEPSGNGAVTVALPATSSCGASGAICTEDGRPLSNSLSATVAGPVGISVADTRVQENEGAVLAFAVTLSRAASGTVRVDYATSDGSAQAGARPLDSSAKAARLYLDEIHAEAARRNLVKSVRQAWLYIEPDTELSWNWHLDELCARC